MHLFENVALSAIRSGVGDCIHIRYVGMSGQPHNVIVDSGPTAMSGEFRRLCQGVQARGEKLDIMLISHYDDDHIGGMLKAGDVGFESYFFNAYDMSLEMSNLSANQNQRLFHVLDNAKVQSKVIKDDVIELDGMKLTIHAPSEETLKSAMQEMKYADENLYAAGDWMSSLDDLMGEPYPIKDNSVSNKASIVFTLEFGETKMLFCGDSWAENIPGGTYDLVKLPHHGSARNISDKMLSRIEAHSFLICADGSRHPNKQTIAKLLMHYGTITIYGNYDWWMKGFMLPEDLDYVTEKKLVFKLI